MLEKSDKAALTQQKSIRDATGTNSKSPHDQEEEEEEIDLKYKHKGKHYQLYKDVTRLVNTTNKQLKSAIEDMDDKILTRIRENEQEYHTAVMRYLKEKEIEIRTVLRKLEEKNSQVDGKDLLIGKLHNLIGKFEEDGKALIARLTKNEGELRLLRETMNEMSKDKAFLVEKVKKEKRVNL